MIPSVGSASRVTVRWFPAQPNADFMFPTAFGSSIWNTVAENLNVTLGEVPFSRQWTPPTEIPYIGTGPCGKREWWENGVPVFPPTGPDAGMGLGFETFRTNRYGQLSCCGGLPPVQLPEGGLTIGGSGPDAWGP